MNENFNHITTCEYNDEQLSFPIISPTIFPIPNTTAQLCNIQQYSLSVIEKAAVQLRHSSGPINLRSSQSR